MTIPTVGVDESSPSGTDNIANGDDRIREHKTQVREILSVDHEYPTSGQSATAGQHKQLTLQDQTDLGTGASGVAILGLQGTAGSAALVFTSEADTDVSIVNSSSQLVIAGGALTSAQVLVGNGSGVATDVALSGDVSLTNTGVATVTDLTITSEVIGDLLRFDGTNWVRLADGTANQYLESDGSGALTWVADVEILDYGSSASVSTTKNQKALKICYGFLTVAGDTTSSVTNLPFSSVTSYVVTVTTKGNDVTLSSPMSATNTSASACTLTNSHSDSRIIAWHAIGT